MIDAKEARRITDNACDPPSKLGLCDLIKNISDKIELAAAAGCDKIELSFTSVGIWRSDTQSADLEEFLKEKLLTEDNRSDVFFDRYAKEFAKRKGWKLVRFCVRHYQGLRCGKAELIPDVEDFIGLIANAGCVITDSFHATAFSCNMNTPMIWIYPNSYSSRLASLLKLVGLEDRHLKNFDDFSYVDNTGVDFTDVNKILEEQRKIGWEFLKTAIS